MLTSAHRNPKTTITDREHAHISALDIQLRVIRAKEYAKQKNILAWGRVVFPHKFYLPFCYELHDYLISIRGVPRSATEAPRNHAKTQIECFLIEIFQALEEPDTFKHYLNVQATKEKALAINTGIRSEIENNEVIRAIYGDQVGKEKWTDGQFVLENGVIFTAISAGQSIRGINHNGVRPDYIVVDDLYDEEDIENPEKTEKKNRWWWGSLYPARAKSRRCSIHLIGTAINKEDLLEQLKTKKRWKCRSFQAIKDFDKKIVLWPELNTFESLMDDKIDMGSIIFSREMQNERRDDASSVIKRKYLENWEFDPIELIKEIKGGTGRILLGTIVGNDPSIGKDQEADDTATCVVVKTGWKDGEGTEWWIFSIEMKPLSLEERVQQLIGVNKAQPKEFPLTDVRIEAIAGFDDYASTVVRRTNLPVTRISHVTDKITNLINKSKYFENGKVHLNKNIEQADKDKLIDQLTRNYPKHDDGRDAVFLTLDDETGIWGFV